DVTFDDGVNPPVTAQVTTDPNGDWTLSGSEVDLSGLNDGPVNVEATSTDPAGNTSPIATAPITLDNSIPNTPTIITPIEGDDMVNGTEAPDVLVEGTAEPNSTIDVTFDDGVNPPVTAQVTTDPNGDWTLSGNEVDLSGLNDGPVNVEVTSTDPAGNTSPIATAPITLDSTIPNTPTTPDLETASDTGKSDTDDITSDTTPTFTAPAGSGNPGDTVNLYADGNPVGSATVQPDGSYSVTPDNPLAEGTPDIAVSFTDMAGNKSALSPILPVTIDSTLPLAPKITSPGVSNDTTPEITGTAEPGMKVNVAIDKDGDGNPEATYETTTDPQGNWKVNLETATPTTGATPVLNDGDRPIIDATAIDDAGNSSDSTNQQLTIDLSAPDVPVINPPNITNDTTPEITGTAEPNATVNIEIDRDGDGTPEATYETTTDPQGNWKVDLETATPITGSTPTINDGDKVSISAIALDEAGNSSQKANQELIIDTTAPIVTIDPITTSDDTPEITGKVDDPQAKISITIDGISYDAINNGDGSWILPDGSITNPLSDGSYDIIASSTDSVGNTSVDDSDDELVVNTIVAGDDEVTIPRGNGSVNLDILANDFDPEGDVFSITSFTQPASGSVSINDNGTPDDPTDDQLVYTPDDSNSTTDDVVIEESNVKNGVFSLKGNQQLPSTDSFSYTVSDSNGNSKTATVDLNVEDKVKLKFSLDNNNANWRNEVGIFKVDDAQGTINGIAPGEEGYIEAALSSGKVIFSALSQSSQLFGEKPTRIIDSFSSNDNLGFFLIQNSTVDSVLAGGNANVIFGSASGEGEQFQNLNAGQIANGQFSLNWEDTIGGGDQDFNDLGLTMEITNEDAPLGSGLQGSQSRELIDITEVSQDQKVIASMEVFGESDFDNIAGLYRIVDESGTVIDSITGESFNPGDEGYAQAALSQSLGEFGENDTGATITLDGGTLYAPYLISDGNTDNVYFSFLEANSSGVDHVRLLGDNTFGFEDLPSGGDLSYDDLVVKMNLTLQ
ncbi:MAG: Ig-like domain-containing protein, partial [Cyanobacteria bacterium P01_A01_bin.45]